MSLVKKLAGETAIYGMSHIFSRVLFFMVFTVYLTRQMPESEYGIYAEMYSYSTIILTILTFRMDTAYFRFGSRAEDSRSVFSTTLIPVLAVCALILLILIPNASRIASLLQYENAPHYISWFAWILCFDAVASMVYAKLRLETRPKRFLVYRVFNVVLTVIGVLFFLEVMPRYFPEALQKLDIFLGVNRSIDYVFFSNLISSALTLLFMIPELSISWKWDGPLFKKMLWYSLPLVFVAIASNINQAFAAPIQRFFLGENVQENMPAVGVYAAAAKLAILLNLFTTAFNYAAEPFFFNHSEQKDSREVYGKVALAFVVFSCLVTLGIVFYLDVLIHLIGYQEGKNIVPILLMAYVFLGLYYNVGIWYKLADKTYFGAIISTVGAIITLVVSITLLPTLGTVASAYAALSCYMTMVLIGYLTGQQYYPIPYPMKKIIGYIFATSVLILFAHWLRTLDLGFIQNLVIFTLVLLGCVAIVYKKEYKALIA